MKKWKYSFHDYLRSSTNVFAKNIYSDKDTSSTSLNKYKDIVVLAADKEYCAVTWNKCDCTQKVSNIIQDGIKQKKYVETTDNILNGLKRFQDFLYRYFYKYEHYKEMQPRYEQSGQFFATRRSHTFESNSGITLQQLKVHPIICKISKEIISTKLWKL